MPISSGCNFSAADTPEEVYTYDASREALDIVEQIMKVNVLPQNFVVRSADCRNALATTAGSQRYILYSTSFLENFKKEANTRWAAYCVLAHEIGHHLSNHNLSETDKRVRKRYELEADRFSGGMLYRLGATLDEAQAGINTFSLEGESETHPAKSARLEAVAVGWKQAEELAAVPENALGQAEDDSDEKKLYDQARAEKDPEKAIKLLDQAIEIKENYADAYLERARRKIGMEDLEAYRADYAGAVDDYTVYLQLRPKNAEAYAERGYAYGHLGQNDRALEDYSRAIRTDPKSPEPYLGRAWAKMNEFDNAGALKDLESAISLKPDFADAHYWHGNILYGFGEYDKAIADFDRALEADPKHPHALGLRAAACQFSGRYAEAIENFNREQELHPGKFTSYLNRGVCYQALGKHREAIADFDVIVAEYPDSKNGYIYRGVSRMALGWKKPAEHDFNQALEKTILKTGVSVEIGCLLIENKLLQEGLFWLDSVLKEEPENVRAKECREKAMRK